VRQRLGQHDLADDEVARLVVREVELSSPLGESSVLEIGAGTGRLTGIILECGSGSVSAIELDPDRIERLRKSFPSSIESGRLRIVAGDARDLPLLQRELERQAAPRRILGSLPYYAATVIIDRLLRIRTLIADLHLIVQREVALRLTASPGTSDYGFLSVLTQARASVRLLRTLSPSCFHPKPSVDSAIVSLLPSPALLPEGFRSYVSVAFRHQRKMLKNNLKDFTDQRSLKELFLALDIPLSARPATLSVETHCRLCRSLAPRREGSRDG